MLRVRWLSEGGAKIQTQTLCLQNPFSCAYSMCHHRMSLSVLISDSGVTAGVGTHTWESLPQPKVPLSTNSNYPTLKSVPPYLKRDTIPPLSPLECFENLCLSNASEKHEKNFLNARPFFLLINYKFAFGVALRQPKNPKLSSHWSEQK